MKPFGTGCGPQTSGVFPRSLILAACSTNSSRSHSRLFPLCIVAGRHELFSLTMDYLSIALSGIYFIVYPVFFVLFLLLQVLGVIAAPLLHLGHYTLYALWYPIHILGKFEVNLLMEHLPHAPLTGRLQTLYIFFGVAVLIGILTGTSLHYVSRFIILLLGLESRPEEQRGRTLASYRKEKQQRLDNMLLKVETRGGRRPVNDVTPTEEYVDWDRLKKGRSERGDGLINTILEEDSTEEDS